MVSRVRAMPGGIRLFLIYGFLILAGIGIVLPSVVASAVGAVPLTFDGLVLMILLAYTIFSLTLVIQRKQAGRGLALGLSSLTLPLLALLLVSQFFIAAAVVALFSLLLFRGLLGAEVRTYLDEP
jgi:hypothetical protein